MTRQGALSHRLRTSTVSWFFLREPQNSWGMEGHSCRGGPHRRQWRKDKALFHSPPVSLTCNSSLAAPFSHAGLCLVTVLQVTNCSSKERAEAVQHQLERLRDDAGVVSALWTDISVSRLPLRSVYAANTPKAARDVVWGCAYGAGWYITTFVSPSSLDHIRWYSYLRKPF